MEKITRQMIYGVSSHQYRQKLQKKKAKNLDESKLMIYRLDIKLLEKQHEQIINEYKNLTPRSEFTENLTDEDYINLIGEICKRIDSKQESFRRFKKEKQ